MNKDTERKKIVKKLKSIIDIFEDDNKKKLFENVITRIAFMIVECQVLENEISKNGCVETWKNGTQEGIKISANIQAYSTLLKGLTPLLKEITNALDKAQNTKTDKNELMEFLKQ